MDKRAAHVTELVIAWITNDHHRYAPARAAATNYTTAAFEQYMKAVLRWSPPGTPAWRAAQELAPNDYARIDWHHIARTLRTGTPAEPTT